MEENEIKSILKEEYYNTEFEETDKRIILEEIMNLFKTKNNQIENMTKFIIANCYDKIEKKIKNDDLIYYGLEGAIKEYFKKENNK